MKRLSEQFKCEVVFLENGCFLQGPSLKRPLVIGKTAQGLYILDEQLAKDLDYEERNKGSGSSTCSTRVANVKDQYSFNCSKDYKAVNLWHSRLGHISPRKLSYMSVLEGFKYNKDSCIFPCDIYARAKQHRLPFHFKFHLFYKAF